LLRVTGGKAEDLERRRRRLGGEKELKITRWGRGPRRVAAGWGWRSRKANVSIGEASIPSLRGGMHRGCGRSSRRVALSTLIA